MRQTDEVTALIEKEYSDKKRFKKAVALLKKPQRLHKKRLVIKMDNGQRKSFLAYRSQHNNARGPFKGGVRFHSDVTKEKVNALSFWMSIKTAVTDIPYGGGKGGVKVNPKELSMEELERLSKAYAKFITPHIGPWKDIPAPDVNTNQEIIAFMLEAFENKVGHHAPAAFTGKPLSLGGSLGRLAATGQGGVFVLSNYAKIKRLKPKNTKVAVQGFGNVGYWFSKLAQDIGYKIVAVSDSSGGVFDVDGVSPEKLIEFKKDYGSLKNVCSKKKYKYIKNSDLFCLNVDVLVPAALENAIDQKNSKKIKAKVILELANGPTTPEAEQILVNKGIDVLPDVLCSAGGVIVSYFEWVQNLNGYQWSKERVNEELEKIMKVTFEEIYELANEKGLTYRQAAYYIATRRIVDAMILRGRV